MGTLIKMVQRNLMVFFKDRSAVFFSFLSVFIIIGLYALFLADTQVQSIKQMTGDVAGIRFLVDSWIMAGLLAVNTVTISLGALAIMVKDRDKGILRDFLVAPISRGNIVLSYIFSTFLITTIVSFIGFFIIELYIYLSGGQLLSIESCIKVLGIILLSILFSTSLMFLISSFLKSVSAFATLSTIVGTLIGFLAGIYVPVGIMPQWVQNIIKILPTSHSAVMLRQIFMEEPLKLVFKAAPSTVAENYKEIFGVIFKYGGKQITFEFMLMYLLIFTVIFIILGILRVRLMRVK